MSIVYIGGFELPDKNAAANLVINMAKTFKIMGEKTYFIGIDKEKNDNTIESFSVGDFISLPLKYPNSPFEWIKDNFNTNNLKIRLQYINSIDKIDYIIGYNLHSLYLNYLLKYSKKNNIKFISNITEWYDYKLSFNLFNNLKVLDNWIVMNRLQKKSDALIVVSKFLRNHYKEYNKKILIVPPLVDISEEKWKKKMEKQDKQLISFVYAGSIEKTGRKDNLHYILEAFCKIRKRNFKFIIAGISEDEYLNTFPEDEIFINKLESKVKFLGRINHKKTIQLLHNSDCSIFIRDKTRKNMAGFPTKFVESTTIGLNLICSNISDVEEYFIKDSLSSLIETNTSDEMLNAIVKILNSHEKVVLGRGDKQLSDVFDIKNWEYKIAEFMNGI